MALGEVNGRREKGFVVVSHKPETPKDLKRICVVNLLDESVGFTIIKDITKWI